MDYARQGNTYRFPAIGYVIMVDGKKVGGFTKEPKAMQFARLYSKSMTCKAKVIEGLSGRVVAEFENGWKT